MVSKIGLSLVFLALLLALPAVFSHPIVVRYSHSYISSSPPAPATVYQYDSFVSPTRYPASIYAATYYPSAYYSTVNTYTVEKKFKAFPVLRYVYHRLDKWCDRHDKCEDFFDD